MAPVLMIAFGLGIEMHKIMRNKEGGEGLFFKKKKKDFRDLPSPF